MGTRRPTSTGAPPAPPWHNGGPRTPTAWGPAPPVPPALPRAGVPGRGVSAGGLTEAGAAGIPAVPFPPPAPAVIFRPRRRRIRQPRSPPRQHGGGSAAPSCPPPGQGPPGPQLPAMAPRAGLCAALRARPSVWPRGAGGGRGDRSRGEATTETDRSRCPSGDAMFPWPAPGQVWGAAGPRPPFHSGICTKTPPATHQPCRVPVPAWARRCSSRAVTSVPFATLASRRGAGDHSHAMQPNLHKAGGRRQRRGRTPCTGTAHGTAPGQGRPACGCRRPRALGERKSLISRCPHPATTSRPRCWRRQPAPSTAGGTARQHPAEVTVR